MDSKIPKPSMLKKPTELSSKLPGLSQYGVGLNRMPLTSNSSNISESHVGRKRAASPDASRFHNRAKLRRSRSVADIRVDFIRPKFNQPTFPTLHAKSTWPPLNVLSNPTSKVGMRRSRSACDIAIKTNAIKGLMRQDTNLSALTTRVTKPTTTTNNKPTVNKPMAKTAPILKTVARKPASNSSTSSNSSTASFAIAKKPTATSTAAPAKSMAKRIPPYDYKARFNDLTEKHQVLKERCSNLKEQVAHLDAIPELYAQCKKDLSEVQEAHEALLIENVKNVKENEEYRFKNASLSASLSETEEELRIITKKFQKSDNENVALKTDLKETKEKSEFLEEENIQLKLEIDKRGEQLFRANNERKELHNVVMDLRGNIRVFCRVRPPLPSELERTECGWSYVDEQSLEIASLESGKNKSTKYDFSFDHVFHPRTRQCDIFENVSPLIQSALDGYNVCIFAYGQTGSGKTFTMDGESDNLGVIPRTVDLIFDSIEDYKRLGWVYEVRVTFLEIYNEILYDLLDTSGTTKELEIRMANARNKTDIYVSNITEETVESTDRLRYLMEVAKMHRATAATASNERSSRSHAVTKIQLIGKHADKGEISMGTVNLVDLAGSESPKTSQRMDETKNINRSLSELSNVILALVQKQDHIPYRNSKLTHLLMPSLGGNSKTLMFVNVAPFSDCFTETVKSLRFAAQVNSCKLAKAKKVKIMNNSNYF